MIHLKNARNLKDKPPAENTKKKVPQKVKSLNSTLPSNQRGSRISDSNAYLPSPAGDAAATKTTTSNDDSSNSIIVDLSSLEYEQDEAELSMADREMIEQNLTSDLDFNC